VESGNLLSVLEFALSLLFHWNEGCYEPLIERWAH